MTHLCGRSSRTVVKFLSFNYPLGHSTDNLSSIKRPLDHEVFCDVLSLLKVIRVFYRNEPIKAIFTFSLVFNYSYYHG